MTSSLYECQVMHARFSPRPHRFVYRIFLFAIDLDELAPGEKSDSLIDPGNDPCDGSLAGARGALEQHAASR